MKLDNLIMLIDTHCHLNFKAFDKDLDEVIKRAAGVGIEKIIIPGAKTDSSEKAIEIAGKYPQCYGAIGVHPHHANETDISGLDNLIPLLGKLAKKNKVVAVGEIGMDYYQYKNYPPVSSENKKLQTELLIAQLDLAVKCKLPVILHCRQAHDDMLPILKKYLTANKLEGVFHCFDGNKNHLETVLSLGFFIGIDGNITYPENDYLRDLVKLIPPDRLVLETDSPYLTPVPLRGTRNEPKNLKYTAEKVALLLHETAEKLAISTSRNAEKLFRL